jgi:hypothetical protein
MLRIEKYPDISVQWLVVNDLSTINVITIDICHSCVINLECKVWNQITFQFYFLDIFSNYCHLTLKVNVKIPTTLTTLLPFHWPWHSRTVIFSNKQYEEFVDTKGAIRIRISKKNRQHNGQKKKYKRQSRIYKTRGKQFLFH